MIIELLENLARKSHQAKGTDSYLPIVKVTHQAILAEVSKMIPKNKKCPITEIAGVSIDSEQFNNGYNQAIQDMKAKLEEE